MESKIKQRVSEVKKATEYHYVLIHSYDHLEKLTKGFRELLLQNFNL